MAPDTDPIVITGMGAVSPLGIGVDANWRALMEGKSGIVMNDRFDVSEFAAKIAGLVPKEFDPTTVVDPKDVLFEIVDPARVLVEASTADASIGGQLGQAAVAGLPGVKLQFLGAARSLREGTLPLTFRAAASGAIPLAIGQPVTVVATLNQAVKGYVLPAQAVTRSASNDTIVWIKAGAERFIPQPVQLRPLDAQTVVVTSGLGAGNRVVVQGASLLAQIR